MSRFPGRQTKRRKAAWEWCAMLLLAAGASGATAQDTPPDLKLESRGNPQIALDRQHRNVVQAIVDDLNTAQHSREVYAFRLAAKEAIQFDLVSDEFDAKLEIYSEDERLLTENDDSGGNRNARLHFANPADRAARFYVVATSNSQRRRGAFSLGYRRRPVPEAPVPLPISDGIGIAGNLSPTAPLRVKDQRVFRTYYFQGAEGERVAIAASGKGGPVELELNKDGTRLALAFTDGPESWPSMFQTLNAKGRYEIAVIGEPDTTTSFELLLRRLPAPKATIVTRQALIGQATDGVFMKDSPVVAGTNDLPYSLYEVEGRAGSEIIVYAAMDRVSPGERNPSPLTVDVGVDSPVGFAVASTAQVRRGPGGVQQTVIRFERDGRVLLRVLGSIGVLGPFTLSVDQAPAGAATRGRP